MSTKFAAPETNLADCQNRQDSGAKESPQRLPESRTSLSELEADRGHWRIFLEKLHYAVFRATCRTILGYDLRVWYGVLLELRSLSAHIKILRARKLYLSGIDLGPGKELSPSGRCIPCKRTLARNRDMQYLLSILPLAVGWINICFWKDGPRENNGSAVSRPAFPVPILAPNNRLTVHGLVGCELYDVTCSPVSAQS
jgi:hypothetical protein